MSRNLYFPNKAINTTVDHYYTDRIEDYQDFFNDQPSFQEISDPKNTKQTAKSPAMKQLHVMNIAPMHTPQSSLGSSNELSENRLANKIRMREKTKAPLLQKGIPIGREVIIVSNHTACSTNATPSSSLQSQTKENPSISRALRPCNTSSGNLSFENANQQEPEHSEESKGERIEDKIEALLMDKHVDAGQIDGINNFFETYTEKSDVLQDKLSVEKHKDVLKKIKLAYEIFFKNYSTLEQRQREKIANETKELSVENEILREKIRERRDLSQNRNDDESSERLDSNPYYLPYQPIARINQSQISSGLLSANKKNSSDRLETPPSRKLALTIEKDRETLRSIISSQQKQLNQLKLKEIDLIKLAEACNKRGIDIMRIYEEEVVGKRDSQEGSHDFPTVNKNAPPSKPSLSLKQLLSGNTAKMEGKSPKHLASGPESSSRTAHDSSNNKNNKRVTLSFFCSK